MDEAEKRRLKKLGKQQVEQQSQALRARLQEANPAPVGSDAWVRNYKAQTGRERALRHAPPDRIVASEATQEFVLNEVDPGPNFGGVPTWYVECPRCHDLLHTVPAESVSCSCGAVRLDLAARQFQVSPRLRPRFVRLIPRGETPHHP